MCNYEVFNIDIIIIIRKKYILVIIWVVIFKVFDFKVFWCDVDKVVGGVDIKE